MIVVAISAVFLSLSVLLVATAWTMLLDKGDSPDGDSNGK